MSLTAALQEATVWEWKRRNDAFQALRHRALRRALVGWQAQASAAEAAEEDASAVQQRLEAGKGKMLQQAFQAWQRIETEAAVNEQFLVQSFLQWQRQVLARQAMLTWRSWHQYRKELRAAQHSLVSMQARSALRRALRCLQEAPHAASERLSAADSLHAGFQERTLRKLVHGWRACTADAQARRLAAEALAVSKRLRMASLVFLEWRVAAAEAARIELAAAAEVCGHVKQRQTCAAFAAWRTAAAAAARDAAEMIRTFAQRTASRILEAALAAWRRDILRKQELRAAAEKLRAKKDSQVLRAAFAEWRAASAQLRVRRAESLRNYRCLLQARKARQAFTAWSRVTAHLKSSRAAAAKLSEQLAKRMLRATFAAWRVVNAVTEHEQAAALEAFISRLAEKRMRRVLLAWRRTVAGLAVAREAGEQLAAGVARRRLRASFASWRVANAVLRHERASCLDSFLSGQAERQMLAVSVAWRQHAAERCTATRVAAERLNQAYQRIQLQACMAAWKSAAGSSRQDRSLKLDSFRKVACQRELSAVVAAWRQLTASAQAAGAAADQLFRKAGDARVRSALLSWQQAAALAAFERAARLDNYIELQRQKTLEKVCAVWRQQLLQIKEAVAAASAMQAASQRRQLQSSFSAWRWQAEVDKLKATQQPATAASMSGDMAVCAKPVAAAAAQPDDNSVAATTAPSCSAELRSAISAENTASGRSACLETIAGLVMDLCSGKKELHQRRTLTHSIGSRKGAEPLLSLGTEPQPLLHSFEACAETEQAAAQLDAADCLAAALASWRQASRDSAADTATRLQINACRARRTTLRAALNHWHCATVVQRRLAREVAKDFAASKQIIRCLAMLSGWRRAARISAQVRESSLRALQERSAAALLRAALTAWRSAAAGNRRAREASLLRFRQKSTTARLRAGFTAWRDAAAGAASKDAGVLLAFAEGGQKRLLGRGFAGWRMRVQLLRSQETARVRRQRCALQQPADEQFGCYFFFCKTLSSLCVASVLTGRVLGMFP